jgi:hypothetical protein
MGSSIENSSIRTHLKSDHSKESGRNMQKGDPWTFTVASISLQPYRRCSWPHTCYGRRWNEAIYDNEVYLWYDWLSYHRFLFTVADVYLQQITARFTEVYEIAEMSLGQDVQALIIHCRSRLFSRIALHFKCGRKINSVKFKLHHFSMCHIRVLVALACTFCNIKFFPLFSFFSVLPAWWLLGHHVGYNAARLHIYVLLCKAMQHSEV